MLALVNWVIMPHAAAAEVEFVYDIPAQPLSSALVEFSRQSNVTFAILDSALRELESQAVSGRMHADEAIARLLADTGYTGMIEDGVLSLHSPSVTQTQGVGPMQTGKKSAFFAGVAALLVGAPSGAQEATPEEDQDSESNRVLEEIVVSAQRREQSIQDVPLSVSAFSMEALEQAAVYDIDGLDYMVPGFHLARSGHDARPSLRGARTVNIFVKQDPVIGFFIDGVYQPRTSQAFAGFYDLQRLEVLRGPQGTLFGRNTYGGAITLYTNPPVLDTFDYGINLEYGKFDRIRVDGFVNVPISDSLAFRFAGESDRDDGYIENLADPLNLGNEDVDSRENWGQRDRQSSRWSLRWTPSENVDAILRYSTWEEGGIGLGTFAYQVYGTQFNLETDQSDYDNGEFFPWYSSRAATFGAEPDEGPYRIRRDLSSVANRDLDSKTIGLDFSIDLGDVLLKSISSYIDYDQWRRNDNDYSSVEGRWQQFRTQTETFSQELQLLSDYENGSLEWVVGAYFLDDDASDFIFAEYYCERGDTDGINFTPSACIGPTTTPDRPDSARLTQADTTSSAVFAQATYRLSEKLSFTGGLRYTEDDKSYVNENIRETYVGGEPQTILDASDVFQETTWRIGFEYAIDPQRLVYAMASTGFNSGGFNDSGVVPSFDEQLVDAYEIGSKSVLADGLLTLNIAAYYNEYTNLVSTAFIQDPVNPDDPLALIPVTTNAGDADAWGVELEANWSPSPQSNVFAAISYLNTELGNFIVSRPFRAGEPTLNLEGTPVAQSPELTAMITGSYDFDLGESGTLTPYVQFTYVDEYLTNDAPLPASIQDSYTHTTARLTWSHPSDRFSVSAYVRNLEDEAVLTYTVFGGNGEVFAHWRRPREWGVEFNIRR